MRRVLHRLVVLFRGDRAEAEAAREIAAHRALLEDDYQRRGMNADAARAPRARVRSAVQRSRDAAREWHSHDGPGCIVVDRALDHGRRCHRLPGPIRRAARVDPLVALRTE
ncbi:MAG TPA: hypothetical protein VKA59_07760 [Vicinamibacterales bacterium]|nr:hypothetical protein [Vicinamibacterales bacterium]